VGNPKKITTLQPTFQSAAEEEHKEKQVEQEEKIAAAKGQFPWRNKGGLRPHNDQCGRQQKKNTRERVCNKIRAAKDLHAPLSTLHHVIYNWEVEKAKEDRKELGAQTASNAPSTNQSLSNSRVMMNKSSIEISFRQERKIQHLRRS